LTLIVPNFDIRQIENKIRNLPDKKLAQNTIAWDLNIAPIPRLA
jgi:hypothetical protein